MEVAVQRVLLILTHQTPEALRLPLAILLKGAVKIQVHITMAPLVVLVEELVEQLTPFPQKMQPMAAPTVPAEETHTTIILLVALDKAPLHASLASLPVSFMPAEVAAVLHTIDKDRVLEALAAKAVEEMAEVALESQPPGRKIRALAEAAALLMLMHKGTKKALLAALASCAYGCIRKRNNKLKGERLCTTL